jgi:hypothetical protein
MMKTRVEPGPIFITGLAHSGKTPLRLILSTHPDLALSRRTFLWDRYFGRFGDIGQPENFESCLNAMIKNKNIAALMPDAERIRREFVDGPQTYMRLFGLFHQHHAEMIGKPRWGVQKGSMESYADLIFETYPAAKMIHMIRNPRDFCEVALSVSGYRLGKVGWHIARWLSSACWAQRNLKRYPHRYKVIRFETLQADPEAAARDICTFLGEKFAPEMIEILAEENEEITQPEGSAPSAQKLQITGGKSRLQMSPGELAFTQAFVQPYFNESMPRYLFSTADRLRYYLVDWPANRIGMIAWQKLKAPSQ